MIYDKLLISWCSASLLSLPNSFLLFQALRTLQKEPPASRQCHNNTLLRNFRVVQALLDKASKQKSSKSKARTDIMLPLVL